MGNTWSLALEGWAMPWGALSTMDLRLEFCALASREGANVRLLCRRYEVAPKTGYKWLPPRGRGGGRREGGALAAAVVEPGARRGGDRGGGACGSRRPSRLGRSQDRRRAR